MPLSTSPSKKLTGPASSNQSRSDQAGREESNHRLGSCPRDEGHGDATRMEELEIYLLDRALLFMLFFFFQRSKTSEEKK